MTRPLVLILILALTLPALAQSALAQPSAPLDTERRFSLQPPSGFVASSPPPKSQALHYFLAEPGIVASVTRFDSANRAAYQRRRSTEFIRQIEAGLAKNVPGYTSHRRLRFRRIERTPVLDLEFIRDASPERVYMRFLFYHRFTVVATASIPAKAARTARRRAQAFSHALLPRSRASQ